MKPTDADGNSNDDGSRLVSEGRCLGLKQSGGRRFWVLGKPYFAACGIVALCGLAGWAAHLAGLANANIVMIFLAGVALAAARLGHGPAITSAILSVLVFDFFFVPPLFSFAPTDAEYFVDLSVMLGIAILISELTARLQTQLQASRRQEQHTSELFAASQRREKRMAQLYEITCQLAKAVGTENLLRTAGQQLLEVFGGDTMFALCQADGSLEVRFGKESTAAIDFYATTAVSSGELAKLALDKGFQSPAGTTKFVPMIGAQKRVGLLGVCPDDAAKFQDVEEVRMLETCANVIALSIERDQSSAEVQQAQVQVQSEQLRNSLLSCVSHDLRTPLAMIAVTSATLLDESVELSDPSRREMLQTLVDESRRLSRQVENLLDMAQLDSGKINLKREWLVLEELVGAAIARLRTELRNHCVQVQIPPDFPLLWVAEELFEQVLINLLENAVRYTPRGSTVEIQAFRTDGKAQIRFSDNGPGLPPGSDRKVFDKFFRGNTIVADGQRGIGLGLTICQSIVQAHGGDIRAANRPTGGAEFIVTLPCPTPGSEQLSEPAAMQPAQYSSS